MNRQRGQRHATAFDPTHRRFLTPGGVRRMARLLWVVVIGAALLVTSSASAQRGGGGKGKGKNRDGFPGRGNDQGSDQQGYGRFRGGDLSDPSGDPSGFGRGRGGQDGRMTMTMMGG